MEDADREKTKDGDGNSSKPQVRKIIHSATNEQVHMIAAKPRVERKNKTSTVQRLVLGSCFQ